MNNKPLRRIEKDAVLGGVAAGAADYFGIDKALMRVIFVILMFFSFGFPIVLTYIILWAALPVGEPTMVEADANWIPEDTNKTTQNKGRRVELIGYALLIIGAIMLFDRLFYWMHLQKFIPAAVLIGIGLFLILKNSDKNKILTTEAPPATPSWTDSAPISSWEPPKPSDTNSFSSEPEEPKV